MSTKRGNWISTICEGTHVLKATLRPKERLHSRCPCGRYHRLATSTKGTDGDVEVRWERLSFRPELQNFPDVEILETTLTEKGGN